jgi:TolA-binding protein
VSIARSSRGSVTRDDDFEYDLGADSLGGDRLTIDEEDQDFDDIDSLTPARVSQGLLEEQVTFDESVDGLAFINVDTPPPELSFSNDSSAQISRPKLSDLGGDDLALRSEPYRDESLLSGTQIRALSDQNSTHQIRSISNRSPDRSVHITRKISRVLIGGFTLGFLVWGIGLIELISPVETSRQQNGRYFDTQMISPRAVLIEVDDHIDTPYPDPKDQIHTHSSARVDAQKKLKLKSRKRSTRSRAPRKKSSQQMTRQNKTRATMHSLLARGEQLLTQGNVNAAQTVFERAQSTYPNSPAPVAQLGWCQLSQRKYKAAVSYFKRALSKSAHHGDSLYGLGYSYEKLGQAREARRYFESYLSRYPSGSKVRVVRNKLSRLPKD